MIDRIDRALAAQGMGVLGTVTLRPVDPVDDNLKSLALIGPVGPVFWQEFSASAEYTDGKSDPLDRWSRRVLARVAADLGATALYPFGGPPYLPFIDWALRSGRVFQSPVTLLVHDRMGLFVSFRGALAFEHDLSHLVADNPCTDCIGQPCRTACPPAALVPDGYDVPACHAWLDNPDGKPCMSGCLVRRACPIGQDLRPAAQSAFHMRAFHRGTS